ncbi:MAG TPA: phage tail protein, partial [Rhizomicrobium sp.]
MASVFAPAAGSNATQPTVYTGINLQSSAQGLPVTIVWGQNRFAPNLFWYANFQSHRQSGKGGGGKGGAKGSGNYTYSAAVMLGLCEGPIQGIGAVWADQTFYATGGLAKLSLTLFAGSASQSVWSYLASNYPSQAIPYESLAYLCNSDYSLGSSASLPNHNFEVIGYLANSMGAWGTPDANPADIVSDFLTNPQYSIGLAPAQIDAVSLAFYKTYCLAQKLGFSPVLDTQEQIAQTLDRWASLSNTWIFWSGGALKFVPLGDSAITAYGATYAPNLTIEYNLTYDDFLATRPRRGSSAGASAGKTGDGGPIQVTRADPADCPNHVKLEIRDRANQYNASPVEWQDQGLVDQFGQIDAGVTTAHEICDQSIAAIAVQLIGQRAAYIRNTYAFKLGYEFSLLEPGDLVTLTDPHLGLELFPVRIRSLDEDENGNLAVVAEEFPGGIGTAVPSNTGGGGGDGFNPDIDPGDVNPPAIFEPDSALTGGAAQVWLSASGGQNWGGAVVSISFDATNYSQVGVITAGSFQGVTTADLPAHVDSGNLDTANTLAIDLTESVGILPTTATHGDADASRTLSLLTASFSSTVPNNGELLAYGAVGATGAYTSSLTYLRRALYGTALGDHPAGSFFTRIAVGNNENLLGQSGLIFPLPAQYIGATIWLKFQSYNVFGNELQDISAVTAYAYTTTGAGYGAGTGGVPGAPTG